MKSERLLTALEQGGVQYEVLHHDPDAMAQETAHDTHTPGAAFAKSVVLAREGGHALAVVPATKRVDLTKAGEALGGAVRLAEEDELDALFPDCEVGAEPPFGNLYGLPVVVDAALAENEKITFNGGTHTQAVRMRYADFVRLVDPQVASLTA